MKPPSKNRRRLNVLKKARNRQNVDRINADFSKYFIDLGSLQNTISALLSSNPKDSYELLSSIYTKPSDIALIDSLESSLNNNWRLYDSADKNLAPVPVWGELSHRMQLVSDSYSPLVLFNNYKKSIKGLNERLRILRQELRKNYSEELLIQINQLVAQIHQLASEAHEDYKLRSRKFHGKLFSFQRDLRYTYRQIIRFLFKNLDDESAGVNALLVRVQNKGLLTSEKINQDEFKKKEMARFYKRSA